MIHLERDAEISGSATLRIATETGDFEDSALISFYDISTPEVIVGAYQAQFIKYGNVVYQFNDPKDLGEAILKIDPTSTHSAASYVRMTNELLAQMNSGSLEPTSLDEARLVEQNAMQEQMDTTQSVLNESSTSTPVSLNESSNELVSAPIVVAASSSSPQTTESSTLEATAVSTTTPSATLTETVNTASSSVAAVAETVDSVKKVVESLVDTVTGSTTPQ